MTDTDAAPSRRRAAGPLAVVAVGMAIAVWWPAFTLGAWGELFFDDVLTLWAASTAAFVVVMFERRPWWRRLLRGLVLLLPSVWVALNFAVGVQDPSDLAAGVLDLIAVASVLLGMPFTIWVLARILWPDAETSLTRRGRWLVALVVAVIAAASFLLGANNARFMTCEDFALSGNSEPPGCVHADPAG